MICPSLHNQTETAQEPRSPGTYFKGLHTASQINVPAVFIEVLILGWLISPYLHSLVRMPFTSFSVPAIAKAEVFYPKASLTKAFIDPLAELFNLIQGNSEAQSLSALGVGMLQKTLLVRDCTSFFHTIRKIWFFQRRNSLTQVPSPPSHVSILIENTPRYK